MDSPEKNKLQRDRDGRVEFQPNRSHGHVDLQPDRNNLQRDHDGRIDLHAVAVTAASKSSPTVTAASNSSATVMVASILSSADKKTKRQKLDMKNKRED